MANDSSNPAEFNADYNKTLVVDPLNKKDVENIVTKKVGDVDAKIQNALINESPIVRITVLLSDGAQSLELYSLRGLSTGTTEEVYNHYKGNVEIYAAALQIPIEPITNIKTLNEAINTVITAILNNSQLTEDEKKWQVATVFASLGLFVYGGQLYIESSGATIFIAGYLPAQDATPQLPFIYYRAETTITQFTIPEIIQNFIPSGAKITLYINGQCE